MSLMILRWSQKAPPVTLGWVSPLGATLALQGEEKSVNTINEFPDPIVAGVPDGSKGQIKVAGDMWTLDITGLQTAN